MIRPVDRERAVDERLLYVLALIARGWTDRRISKSTRHPVAIVRRIRAEFSQFLEEPGDKT